MKPADPATIPAQAQGLFDFAVSVTGCAHPLIAENELFGAQTSTPWRRPTRSTARTSELFRSSEARRAPGDHDREPAVHRRRGGRVVARGRAGGDPDPAGLLHLARTRRALQARAGAREPLDAQRHARARRALRRDRHPGGPRRARAAVPLPPDGGARKGLQPGRVARDREARGARGQAGRGGVKIEGVWSWGWPTFTAAGADPDKPAAACVWLWTRDPKLCDGPRPPAPFDTSLTEGQLALPPGVRCTLGGRTIGRRRVGRLTPLTGDSDYAASVAAERAVLGNRGRSTRQPCLGRARDRRDRLRRQPRALPRRARARRT